MPHPADRRPLDIIIPFYRNAGLIPPLFRSLKALENELCEIDGTVVAVNDSPDDAELEVALGEAIVMLAPTVPCRLIRNEQNLGFVRSVNRAARESVAAERDIVLLNSDTVVFSGALRELRKVAALDPLIGFVSPRSNNATICTLPVQEEFRHIDADQAFAIFREISGYLPEYHLVPTAVGFCLYIKLEVLKEFGLFDETYGKGYHEENDLIMRANRCGYRAALANHAFVYHVGESSFSVSASPKQIQEKKNTVLLKKRYPEYGPNIDKYFSSSHYQAERLLTGMVTDAAGRRDLVFDFSTVGPYHNGTFEAGKEILVRAAKTWHDFNIYVMASDEAIRFHGLDALARVFLVSPTTRRIFAVAFRFGQPFDYQHLFRMSRLAPLNVFGMLDTIAYDCLHLNNVKLDEIWGAVFAHADGVIYISDFVEKQFRSRFRRRDDLRELVAYLSLDYRDYTDQVKGAEGTYMLVVGNAFAHKRVPATVDALSRAFPREKIVVLGLPEDSRQNVISYKSGDLSEKQMDQLMRGARFVVFPSVYEGFGIPVVRSLAYGKPVLARSIPTNQAIKEKLGEEDNLVLYSSTDELIDRLRLEFPRWKSDPAGQRTPGAGWDSTTEMIGQFLREQCRSVSFQDVLVPRLEHMRLLEERELWRVRAKTTADARAAGVALGNTKTPEQLEALNLSLRAREAQIKLEGSNLDLRAREAQIEDIYHSWSWRLTAPLRRMMDAYLGLRGKK